MWIYEKKLECPVDIAKPNPRLAKIIMSQYGGPDGELGASLRYLSQRFTAVTPEAKAILTDIGTEELAHLEMIGAIVQQLTSNLSKDQIVDGGFMDYYVDHTKGIYPQSAGGTPWSAAGMQSKGDPVADMYENLAAEQKARATYENILDFVDDPQVAKPIIFLREREIVHFQRFGETLNKIYDYMNSVRKA